MVQQINHVAIVNSHEHDVMFMNYLFSLASTLSW